MNLLKITTLILLLFVASNNLFAQQISVNAVGVAVTEDFNTLGSSGTSSTLPNGWYMAETGTNANTTYTAGTGSSNAGDTYSFGSAAAADRAFGGLRSGSLIPLNGAKFLNNTGVDINKLDVTYTGEHWRLGAAGRADMIKFEFSTDATSLTTGTWTNVSALNFSSPTTATVGAKDGNVVANRATLSATITSLYVANGANFWVRWTDFDASGADDGMGVDDFSLTANYIAPNLSINDITQYEGNTGTSNFNFSVSLSNFAGTGGVTFDITTQDNTALSASDYATNTIATATIPAGSNVYTFPVAVNGDNVLEASETFFVNVTNVTGATLVDGQGIGTITNDDSIPNVLTDPQNKSVCEGQNVSFYSNANGKPTLIQWQSAASATGPWTDISGANSNTYSFTTLLSNSGTFYRVMFTNVNGADSSNAALLTVNQNYLLTQNFAVCSGSNYTFPDGTTITGITAPTSHTSIYFTTNLCDSNVVTNLTINPVYTTNNPQAICNGDSYVYNGHTYATQGTYSDTLDTYLGCDSIIFTQLTVRSTYSVNNAQVICPGDSYTFNGNVYSTLGTHRDTLQTIFGCDSVINTLISFHNTYSVNNPQAICPGGSYTFNGNVYSTVGTYRDTLQTVFGCDSVINTIIGFHNTYSVNNPQVICPGSSYTFNGNVYSTLGTHRDTLQTVFGCDSVINTQISFYNTYSVNNPQVICPGSAYTFNGHIYTTAGNHNDTLQTINGCDSIIVTQISFFNTYSTNNPQEICAGGSYIFNGHTYTTAGNHNDTLQSINGCDSIIVTQLAINPNYTTNNPQTICDGGAYVINGHTYNTPGTFNDLLQSVKGCDSLVVTLLTINPVYTTNNPQTICSGDVYTFNGNNYTTTNNYNDTLTSATGCDSIIITQLTVKSVYSVPNNITVCVGGSYSLNGHTYNSAGTYHDTLQSAYGCDSIVNTNLAIGNYFTSNNPQSICNGSAYTMNGNTYTTPGSYNDTLVSTIGCDSIVTTILTVNNAVFVSNPQTICEGGFYAIGNSIYTLSGNYTDTIATVAGCDSIVTTKLTVNFVYTTNNSFTLCNGDAYIINGHTYTSSGTYTDVIQSATACDSTVITQLAFVTVNTALTANATTLTSNELNADAYQWVDCDNSNAPIAGETNSAYTATTNGNYAVQITIGDCITLSDCANVNTIFTSLAEFGNDKSLLYPNPNDGNFIYIKTFATADVYVMNTLGQVVANYKVKEGVNELNIESLNTGAYTFKVVNAKSVNSVRVIIAK